MHVILEFQNGDRPPSWILKFSQNLSKNSNLCLFLRPHAKFGEDRTIRGRVIAYFRFSKWQPSAWILKFLQYLSKIQIIAYFYVHMQNLVEIG